MGRVRLDENERCIGWIDDEEEEYYLSILECDDFWYDEEERHELF